MIPLELGHYHHSRYLDMIEDRREVEEWWQEISEKVLPRKSYVTEANDGFADNAKFRRLVDTTAVDACQTLANGHSSYITPADQRWFYWSAPERVKTDEVEGWYRHCSTLAAMEISSSNFYTNLDEAYLDRSGFGIATFSAWPSRAGGLNVQVHPVNSYTIEESEEGYVDTIYFLIEKGIRQLVLLLGEDNIQKSEKLATSWKEYKMKGRNKKHRVLHCVYPREMDERELGSRESRHMPYGSLYICYESKVVLDNSGFQENPYCSSRYLKHSGRGNQYGFSPAWRSMPVIDQLNFFGKVRNLVAEKQAVPSVLYPDYMEGDIDLRGGGATAFKAGKTAGSYHLPHEWGNQGRYDVTAEEMRHLQEGVKAAFHVDLFKMFAEMDRAAQMTRLEVGERASEKMVQFAPSFTRFTADFQTFMNRIFGILLRQGKFPPPPDGAIVPDPYTGKPGIENPQVIYQSKIALALQQLQNSGADQMMERALGVSAVAPEVLDNINLDQWIRSSGRNDGVHESLFHESDHVEAIRDARAQQQEQERQLAMAEQAASAAGKVGMTV